MQISKKKAFHTNPIESAIFLFMIGILINSIAKIRLEDHIKIFDHSTQKRTKELEKNYFVNETKLQF
jgi:hypothetical protein